MDDDLREDPNDLITLSLLDFAVIFLMWHEYRVVKKHGFSWRKKYTDIRELPVRHRWVR
ncbi:MAG: hypothetical protein ACMG50_02545 [Thermomonas sp.]